MAIKSREDVEDLLSDKLGSNLSLPTDLPSVTMCGLMADSKKFNVVCKLMEGKFGLGKLKKELEVEWKMVMIKDI